MSIAARLRHSLLRLIGVGNLRLRLYLGNMLVVSCMRVGLLLRRRWRSTSNIGVGCLVAFVILVILGPPVLLSFVVGIDPELRCRATLGQRISSV